MLFYIVIVPKEYVKDCGFQKEERLVASFIHSFVYLLEL